MKKSWMENICRGIVDLLAANKRIDEDIVFTFLEGIIDILEGDKAEQSTDFKRLSDTIGQVWQYRQLDQLSSEQIFLSGGIWSSLRLLELRRNREKHKFQISELILKYQNNDWSLKAIDENPGIRHKDLAAIGGISPSQLSQYITSIYGDGLLTYNRVGREKYYILLSNGALVYEEIKKKKSETPKRKAPVRYAEVWKAATITNNEDYFEDSIQAGMDAFIPEIGSRLRKGNGKISWQEKLDENVLMNDYCNSYPALRAIN